MVVCHNSNSGLCTENERERERKTAQQQVVKLEEGREKESLLVKLRPLSLTHSIAECGTHASASGCAIESGLQSK